MKFDAYAGNVTGDRPEQVAGMVAFALKGRIERGRPRGRYSDVFEVKDGEDGCGWVGHDAQLDTAFFEFKGSCTPGAVSAIRRHWPDRHTVSRLDSCEDFNEPATYGRLVELVDGCVDPRVKSHEIRPRDADRGITTYWGAASSRVMVRCYEAGKMKERLHLAKPHWVRLEAQVRPGKAMEKQIAATTSAVDVWGFSAWSQRVALKVSEVEVQRFSAPSAPSEFNRTTAYLARAFKRHWEAMLAERGDWLCIGREFEEVWKKDEEAKAMLDQGGAGQQAQ